MQDTNTRENEFLRRVTEIIEENISNNQFGVSELAREIGMSRSTLLRKIKKLSTLSVSQFLSRVRLTNALEMLGQKDRTVSEVSCSVGFSSTSYLIKCFREYYGYPPGEVRKREISKTVPEQGVRSVKKILVRVAGAGAIVIVAVILLVVLKSIAQMEKVPTTNLEAYDYLLKGLQPFQAGTREGLEEAISLFKKAIELEKRYSDQIDHYADRALFLDPVLPQSLIAKSIYHLFREEYDKALPYLEKTLEYNPNSSMVINILSDSAEASYIYLHVGNAFMQSKFIGEAERYTDVSLEYNQVGASLQRKGLSQSFHYI
jgi:AraC-like DNA-binding protein